MKYLLLISLLFLTSVFASDLPKSKELKCAVCRSLVGEFHHEINKVDPRKKIDVGSYRLQTDGGQKTNSRSYAGSETHMTELIETLCESFKDYAQAHHKVTKRLEVVAIVNKEGKMNPRFGEYDVVHDPDLNKGLEFHCQSIVEDFEDEVLGHFAKVEKKDDIEASQARFCTKLTKLCPKDRKTEL